MPERTCLLEGLLDNYRRVDREFEITDECEKEHFDPENRKYQHTIFPFLTNELVSRIEHQRPHKACQDLVERPARKFYKRGKSLKKANHASCLWYVAWKSPRSYDRHGEKE